MAVVADSFATTLEKSAKKQRIPQSCASTLLDLWHLSNYLWLCDADVSRETMKEFLVLAKHCKFSLPNLIKFIICSKCGSIQVPGLSCRSKMIQRKKRKLSSGELMVLDLQTNSPEKTLHHSKHTRSDIKATPSSSPVAPVHRRFKKNILRTCLYCNACVRHPCNEVDRAVLAKRLKKRAVRKRQAAEAAALSVSGSSCNPSPRAFSFLNALSSKSSSTQLDSFPHAAVAIAPIVSPPPSLLAVDLVELERSSKKQKRRLSREQQRASSEPEGNSDPLASISFAPSLSTSPQSPIPPLTSLASGAPNPRSSFFSSFARVRKEPG
jgi:RNase P subunit RPR2